MIYQKNHCWCFSSNWGEKEYTSKIMVVLQDYGAYKFDWENLTCQKQVFDEKGYEFAKENFRDENYTNEALLKSSQKQVASLKPEVFKWLNENVKDFKNEKGWCVGTDQYNINHLISYNIFFQRKKDAMEFIKVWSKWKKPLIHNDSVGIKELNTETMKYENRG